MLALDDAIELAGGVHLDGDRVVDDARATCHPANDTALFILRRCGRPLGSVAGELARSHRIGHDRARDDVLRFALALNHAHVANVVRGTGRLRFGAEWLRLALRLAPAGVLPPATSRRVALDTSRPARAALDAARALWRRAFGIAVASVVVAAPGRATPAAVALAVGVGVSVAVHEAGHAALLVGTCAALVVSRFRAYVVHPPLAPARRSLVAAGGPLAAILVGAGVVAAGWLTAIPVLALAGCAPAAHAVGLTVATADGRAACGL